MSGLIYGSLFDKFPQDKTPSMILCSNKYLQIEVTNPPEAELFLISSKFVQPIIVDGVAIKQPQTDSGIMGLLIAFFIIPAILLVISAVSLKWFPLDGPEWLKKKKYIMELHAQKEREYLQKLAGEENLKS